MNEEIDFLDKGLEYFFRGKYDITSFLGYKKITVLKFIKFFTFVMNL